MRFITPLLTAIRHLQHDHLQIEPTTRCNLSCPTCSRKNGVPLVDVSPAVMNDILVRHPVPESIKLQGLGEPLMHPDMASIISVARKHCDHIGTFTNGTIYNRNITEMLDYVTVSLDSLDTEKLKQIKGRNYNLQTVLANIVEYNSRVLTTVNFTRTAHNWQDEPLVKEWCLKNGVAFNVTRVQNWSEPGESSYAADNAECRAERAIFGNMPSEEPRCLWRLARLYYYRADGTRAPCCRRMNYRE